MPALTSGKVAEGFSVSHAAILDGTTGAEEWDVYGIREGSLELDTDSYDNTGDDTTLSTWNWFNFATLSIQSGFIPLELVADLSGDTITTDVDNHSMPLWSESSLNQPARPVLIRVPSKTAAGAPRTLDFVLYKVQFDPISFDGPSYKDGLLINYSGKALMSGFDETGEALAERAIGRLLLRDPANPPS